MTAYFERASSGTVPSCAGCGARQVDGRGRCAYCGSGREPERFTGFNVSQAAANEREYWMEKQRFLRNALNVAWLG